MAKTGTKEDIGIQVEEKLEKPPMYKVILLNDDFTPMDFVILVLKKIFRKDDAAAYDIMMKIHTQGSGIAGVYSFEIAEMKSAQANLLAKENEHPLKTVIEKDA